MKPTKRKLKIPKKESIIFLLAVLALLAVAVPNYERLERAWKLTFSQAAETSTEFFFNDPAAVPAKLEAGKSYTIPFTIVNHEGKQVAYRYRVEINLPSGTQTSSAQTVNLKDGQRVERKVNLSLKQPGSRAELIVRLLDQNRVIRLKLST